MHVLGELYQQIVKKRVGKVYLRGKNGKTAKKWMSLKAESICFSQLKGDRLGEAIVCCQYPAAGVWQAD